MYFLSLPDLLSAAPYDSNCQNYEQALRNLFLIITALQFDGALHSFNT